jgi:hypothetical protein
MDPISLVKLAWSDTRTRIIFPGLLLASGAALAGLPTTGGRLVCDQGMCVQEQTAAFGTVRNAIMYPTSEIDGFRVERGDSGEMSRVVIDLWGISEPLTVPFTLNVREVERIASEGSRFLAEGATSRFVAALEVQGPESFYRPFALALLVLGASLAGWVLHSMPRPGQLR